LEAPTRADALKGASNTIVVVCVPRGGFWIAKKIEGERKRERAQGIMNKCVGFMRVQAENPGRGEPTVWGSVSAGVQSKGTPHFASG